MSAAAGGEFTSVEDVFSTTLYEGDNGNFKHIRNGINLGTNYAGSYTQFTLNDANEGSFLYKSSDLTSNTNSKTFTISAWMHSDASNNFRAYQVNSTSSSGNQFYLMMSGALVRCAGKNTSGTTIVDTGWISTTTNRWHHFIVSVDLTDTSKRHFYIDDAAASPSWTYTNDFVDFTSSHHFVNAYRLNSGTQGEGGMTQIFLDYTYRDLSVTNNRRTFITADGQPAGDLSSLNPILYLPLDADNAPETNLGTGGDFTAYNYPLSKTTGGPYISDTSEGGLVWIKDREYSAGGGENHGLYDTERGATKALESNSTVAQYTETTGLSEFNNDGFTVRGSNQVNRSGSDITSWTFRKAPKFFDVVTWTGNGVSGRTISHNLGSVPGCIIVKCTSDADLWPVFHRSLGPTKRLRLNTTNAADSFLYWNNTAPTDSVFTVNNSSHVNGSGRTYVAYLFAHNDGDGEFGPTGDQDIIKCGSYTGAYPSGIDIDLGFEAQWILFKNTTTASDWFIYDNMRGFAHARGSGDADYSLAPNSAKQENGASGGADAGHPTPDGFKVTGGLTALNVNGNNHIYVAIRRGPMATPTRAADVFDQDKQGNLNNFTQGPFPVDFVMQATNNSGQGWAQMDRLRGGTNILSTNNSNVENTAGTGSFETKFDYQNGVDLNYYSSDSTTNQVWSWRRAPGFFDIVTYDGTGTSGYQSVEHNLGVAPEMMWIKARNLSSSPYGQWYCYHKDMQNQEYLWLNSASATDTTYFAWTNSLAPSATTFTVAKDKLARTSEPYIAYLFASVDGVSKVGSYTGTGSDGNNLDFGFSNGTRFILIKGLDAGSNWFIWDTERGITSSYDWAYLLNNDGAEESSSDDVDPYSAGITVNYSGSWGSQINTSGHEYIYYAIAA